MLTLLSGQLGSVRIPLAHQIFWVLSRQIHWPTSANPTPYEIFGLSPDTFDKKKLHKQYFKLAKVYHPDVQNQATLQHDVSSAECSERFKKLVDAYSTLKDDNKRRAWDLQYRLGGLGNSGSTGYPAYRPSNANPWAPGSANSGYYSANYNSYTYNRKPNYGQDNTWSTRPNYSQDFDDSLKQNRMWLLKLVVGAVLFIAVIELATVNEVSERRSLRLDEASRDAGAMHLRANQNYGMGLASNQRIQRFIEHRERTLKDREREREGSAFSYSSLREPRPAIEASHDQNEK